jgi:hypothetical protein
MNIAKKDGVRGELCERVVIIRVREALKFSRVGTTSDAWFALKSGREISLTTAHLFSRCSLSRTSDNEVPLCVTCVL